LIGERSAEVIKTTIGNAYPDPQNLETIEVKGRDLASGIPKILSIDSEEIRISISEQIDAIIETVKIALEQTPPELSADIVDRGIMKKPAFQLPLRKIRCPPWRWVREKLWIISNS